MLHVPIVYTSLIGMYKNKIGEVDQHLNITVEYAHYQSTYWSTYRSADL